MAYEHAEDFNNEGDLTALSPQPATPGGLQIPERNYAADNSDSPNGALFIELVYTYLDPQEFNDLNAEFGISLTTTSAEGTWSLRTNTTTGGADQFDHFNGTVHYPERVKRTMLGYVDVVYRITGLEEL